jgi:hypothetical protein
MIAVVITYDLFLLLQLTLKHLFLFDLPGIVILNPNESIVFLVTKIAVFAEYSRPANCRCQLVHWIHVLYCRS